MSNVTLAELDFSADSFVSIDSFPLGNAIMPLVHQDADGNIRPLGTCFSITNGGLCLTARHVIEEALPEPLRTGRKNTDSDGWIYALYSSTVRNEEGPGEYVGGLLPVANAYISNSLDIAAFQLSMLTNVKTGELLPMPAHALSFGLPTVGEPCYAMGYHNMIWDKFDDHGEINHRLSGSMGTVEEIYNPRRDSVNAPFPCFRTSGRYDPGMSGGPVLGADGKVCGVVCSSLALGDEHAGYTSLASLVSAAMLLHLDYVDEAGNKIAGFLHDLCETRAIHAQNGATTFKRSENSIEMWLGGYRINNFRA